MNHIIRFPVVIFSHMLSACRTTYSFLCTDIASQVFIQWSPENSGVIVTLDLSPNYWYNYRSYRMLITYLFISMSAHCSGHIFRDNKNLISKFLSSRFFEDLPLKKTTFWNLTIILFLAFLDQFDKKNIQSLLN